MVRRLQHAERRRRQRVRKRRLDRGPDVPGQDQRHRAEPQFQHHRVVVARTAAFPVGRRRVEHADIDAGDARLPAGRDSAPFGPRGGRRAPHDVEHGQAGDRHAFPHLRRRDQRDQAGGAADVVGVGVGQEQRVERADALRPQRRCDDPRADVEPAAGERAAGVDEPRPAVREADQRGVTLADVERDDAQPRGSPEQRRCAARRVPLRGLEQRALGRAAGRDRQDTGEPDRRRSALAAAG